MQNKILLVDFYNLFIRNFNVLPITNDNGEHFGGTFGFLRCLKYAIDEFRPSIVYVISDGKSSGLRRKLVDPNYKSSRKREWKPGSIKAYDFLNESDQIDNFSMQVNRLNEYLSILPVKTLKIDFVEADDLIAQIVNTMPSGTTAIIYSTDSDFKQLVDENIMCYNPMAKQLTTIESFFEKHEYRVDNYIYFKVVVGDKSDDLPGVNGIGEKTFIKLFPHVKTEHINSLDELFEYSRHVIESKSKIYSKSIKSKHADILKSEDLIRKNYQLMQLKHVDISIQSKDVCEELQNDIENRFNKFKLRTMFISDKLNSHVKYFDDWSRVFNTLVKNRSVI